MNFRYTVAHSEAGALYGDSAQITTLAGSRGGQRMETTGNTDYSYKVDFDLLTIRVNVGMWSIDLLPIWLSEIFTDLMLDDAERIRNIEVQD